MSFIGSANAVDKLIIKYKPTSNQSSAMARGALSREGLRAQQMQQLSTNSLQKISTAAGIKVQEVNRIGTGAHVIQLANDVSENELQQIIKNIKSDPSVDYVVEERPVYAFSVPVLNESQWDMQLVSTNTSNPVFSGWMGDNLQGAWTIESNLMNILYPGTGVTVAVIDTGYTPHQNFVDESGNWHLVGYSNATPTSGYQFLSSSGGVDAPNALDTGDYGTCNLVYESSSWHGTHVTGTIVAQGYNGESGIKGGAFGANVLPVRVLGTCGSGGTPDIENGMLWAAGFSVNGIPGSTTPANVINLSLGTNGGGCGPDMQDTINTITNYGNNGVIIVAAAGNEAQNVNNVEPAGCQYVVSVAAKGPTNTLAFYSNYGNTTITASGGDSGPNAPTYTGYESEVLSTIWSSTAAYESPANGGYGIYQAYEGTSQATPHVSATIADIIGILQANGKSWNYASMVQILQQTAGNLSSSCNTGAWSSGSGGGCVVNNSSLNSGAAINLAITNPPTPVPNPTPGFYLPSHGGGCSVVQNGDDSSLLLLLLLGSGIYMYRKKYLNKLSKKQTK